MKKINTIALSLFACLFSCLFMSACTIKEKFLITATYDSLLGSVSGVDSLQSKVEGTTITLKATAKTNAEFVCWIKDYEEIIVGNDNEASSLTLTYGSDTAGNYTALFREKGNYQSMQYVKLTKIELQESVSQIEIRWNSEISSQDNENMIIKQNPSISNNVETNRVIYLGGLGQNLSYYISGNISISNRDETTHSPITFESNLVKSTFVDNSSSVVIQGNYGNNKIVKLTFEKL